MPAAISIVLGTIVRDTKLIIETAHKMSWNVDIVGQFASYDTAIAKRRATRPKDCMHDAGALRLSRRSRVRRCRTSPSVQGANSAATRTSMARSAIPPRRSFCGAGRAGQDLTTDSFIKAMESIKDYHDIFGVELSFGPDQHHGSTRSFLTVVKNGRWVPVEKRRWGTDRRFDAVGRRWSGKADHDARGDPPPLSALSIPRS